jgi:hypothetical protein
MSAARDNDYRQLELDSSNLVMEWDGRSVLGRHKEAAHAVWRAGHLRRRMGELSVEAGDFARAAEDWLSAVACFLHVDAEELARETLKFVQGLKARGLIPEKRTDLLAALRERQQACRGKGVC